MNKAFEKIMERLEEETDCPNCSIYCADANICGFEEMKKQAKQIVQEVSEEYNDGWIPCSERLPEVDGLYICSCKSEEESIILQFATIDKSWIDELYDVYEDVTAWLSLPEPYHQNGA